MGKITKDVVAQGVADMVAEALAGDIEDLFNGAEWTLHEWEETVIGTNLPNVFLVTVDGQVFRITVTKAQMARLTLGFRL
jgi:hypothetical protein